MNVRDWRETGADALEPLYERGRQGWLHALGWDTARSLREVEHARTTWGLPGLVAADDAGDIRGWTFFLREDDILHVGGLAADTPRATSALLEALVEVSESHGAARLSCFMFDEAPGLTPELARRGFEIEPFLYLARHLEADDADAQADAIRTGASSVGDPIGSAWHPEDVESTATLLREAYDRGTGRHFAPHHTAAEWRRYVGNLVHQTACGELNAAATRVVRANRRIEALVLVTALSGRTAHFAQVVVHPARRRERLASRLIAEASAIAVRQGFTMATLLVGSANASARRLYESLGFTQRGTFVAASRPGRHS